VDLRPDLLPVGTSLRSEELAVDDEAQEIVSELPSMAASCPCPSCQLPAARIHSHYQRTIADLPWAELVVRLRLPVRKCFCDNAACPRKVFTERLPSLVAPSARRTLRLAQQHQQLGRAVGGNPSTHLRGKLDRAARRTTLLRLVRRRPLPAPAAPAVVGSDDWAWNKGQRYGTISVDRERPCPSARLHDRNPETRADGLKQQPRIRRIARDRAGSSAAGAPQGAPQAVQVADRFHRLGNLADTLLPVVAQQAKLLRELTGSPASHGLPPAVVECGALAVTAAVVQTRPPPPPSPKHQAQAAQRRAARLARSERARELPAQGWPIRAIGRALGLNRNTVPASLRAPRFPERQPPILRQPGVRDPCMP